MTVGTGIFLSAIFIGTVALFIATKDRWHWKKITIWSSVMILGLPTVGGIGIYAYTLLLDRPRPQTGFWDIPLNASKADVKFLKGVPKEGADSDAEWSYSLRSPISSEEIGAVVVRFKSDKIRAVIFSGDSHYAAPNIPGVSTGTPIQAVIDKYGQPSRVSSSKDYLQRIYCFEGFNLVVWVEQNKVLGYGVYDPSFGPIAFTEELKQ